MSSKIQFTGAEGETKYQGKPEQAHPTGGEHVEVDPTKIAKGKAKMGSSSSSSSSKASMHPPDTDVEQKTKGTETFLGKLFKKKEGEVSEGLTLLREYAIAAFPGNKDLHKSIEKFYNQQVKALEEFLSEIPADIENAKIELQKLKGQLLLSMIPEHKVNTLINIESKKIEVAHQGNEDRAEAEAKLMAQKKEAGAKVQTGIITLLKMIKEGNTDFGTTITAFARGNFPSVLLKESAFKEINEAIDGRIGVAQKEAEKVKFDLDTASKALNHQKVTVLPHASEKDKGKVQKKIADMTAQVTKLTDEAAEKEKVVAGLQAMKKQVKDANK